ncbi:hypothetical protein Vi05172_g3006 [Venturia inaequalis]|nr:hypothetical protein Vi05172_g3006 [Venturia inaequalis]
MGINQYPRIQNSKPTLTGPQGTNVVFEASSNQANSKLVNINQRIKNTLENVEVMLCSTGNADARSKIVALAMRKRQSAP